MMAALLSYAYCHGVYSPRGIAQAWENRVDFMAVTGLNRPGFRTVSDFREGHQANNALSHGFDSNDELG